MNKLRFDGITYRNKIFTPFIFYCILFLIAFLFGVLAIKFDYAFSEANDFSALLSNTVNDSFLNNFLTFALSNFVFIALICISGYFTFGIAISNSLFICYGLYCGGLFALVNRLCGAVGVAVNITLNLLPAIFMIMILAVMSISSAYFSTGLAVAVFSNRSLIGIKNRMNDMLVLFCFSIPCVFAVSALRALFILIFSGVFFA